MLYPLSYERLFVGLLSVANDPFDSTATVGNYSATMKFPGFPAVAVLSLTLSLAACGGNDSASDTTAAPDSSVVADTTVPDTTVPEPAETSESTESTVKKAEYCGASDELEGLSFSTLTKEQASAAAKALDAVYAGFPDNMKPHAGPLLDFFIQFQSMGGTANQEYVDHLAELNGFLYSNC